jgi:hypothetical protein
VVWFLRESRLPRVLVVWNAMLKSVFLKILVMCKVSLPIYVKVVHFLVSLCGRFLCLGLSWVWGFL